MISYDEETVFNITVWEPLRIGDSIHNFQDKFGCSLPFNYLPRVGDTVEIDSYYFEVLKVVYGYKNQFDVSIYVSSKGDLDTLEQQIIDEI